MATRKSAFVVVANRLPVDRVEDDDGEPSWRTSPGGLVTALAPVLRQQDGVWIGWPGDDLDSYQPVRGRRTVARSRSRSRPKSCSRYYDGMSNATLWPLYHDLVAKPEFHREWWDAYVDGQPALRRGGRASTSRRAAWSGCRTTSCSSCRRCCAQLRPDVRIGFFLHIPFPPTELFKQLPWRDGILEGHARRRPGRLPAARRGGELRPDGAGPARLQDPPRPDHPRRRPRGRCPGVPDLDRRQRPRGAGPHARGREASCRDPQRPRQPAATSCSASTGSTTPRASGSGCARSAS